MNVELSERQRSTVATAITVLSAAVILCAIAAIFWLLGKFLATFSHVFLPLAVAGVVSLILKPFFDFLVERWRFPRPLALVAIFLAILLPVVALGWFFGGIIVEQVSDLIDRIPAWWQSLVANIQERWPRIHERWQSYDMDERLRQAVDEHGGELFAGLQFLGIQALAGAAGIFGALGALFSWAVLPVYIAFFLFIDPRQTVTSFIDSALPFLKPETRDDVHYLIQEFIEIIVAFFRGQLVIAFLQGVLYATGFQIAGLRYGFILGLLLGFLNIIPYLGSIVGLGVALPLALFQEGGGWSLVVWVIVVFIAVQTIEGYLLTPKIMGDQTGLHPMAIIVAVFFWGSALPGVTGLLLAIPLTAFFVVFWRLAREKYIREVV